MIPLHDRGYKRLFSNTQDQQYGFNGEETANTDIIVPAYVGIIDA